MIHAHIGFADIQAWPDTLGFHPVLTDQGWDAWMRFVHFDEVAKVAGGSMFIDRACGVGPRDKIIGYDDKGHPVLSKLLTYAEMVGYTAGIGYPHIGREWVAQMSPRGQLYSLTGHVGGVDPYAPSIGAGAPMDAYAGLLQCRVRPSIDALGEAASKADATVKALDPFLEFLIEPSALFAIEATKWTGSLAAPNRIYQPVEGKGSLVYIVEDDPQKRFTAACDALYQRREPVIKFRPDTSADWGHSTNLSIKQIEAIKGLEESLS